MLLNTVSSRVVCFLIHYIRTRAVFSQSFSSSPNTKTRDPSSVILVRKKGQYLHCINAQVLHVGRERKHKI